MKRKMFHAVDLFVILTIVTLTLLETFVFTKTYAKAEERVRAVSVVLEETDGAAAGTEEETEETDALQTAAEEIPEDEMNMTQTENELAAEDEAADETDPDAAGPVVSENSYQDENISIEIEEYRYNDSTVYVADVRVSSPEYLYAALAQNSYGKNVTEKTSEMAEDNNAILAVNGDYYGARNAGYVLRNGYLYRTEAASSEQEDLVIEADGSFSIITEGSVSAEELSQTGAWQVLSFGPALIVNGEIAVGEEEEVGKAMASNPRTAICEIEPLHYLLVVSDGRTDESEGLSLYELAEFLQSLGVSQAYNLDGGGSSTMVFMGEIVNNPTTSGNRTKERSVSDAVCIGY